MLVRASLVVLALGLITMLSFNNDAFAVGQNDGANVNEENEAPNISGTRTIKIDTIPRIGNVIVDDTIYLPTELPLKFNWKVNSRHTIEIEKTVKNGDDSRYVFDMWTDQSNSITKTVTVKDNVSLRAMFKEQNRLKINSDVGTLQGGGWYDEGEAAQFSISGKNIIQDGTDHRYVFDGWSDGNSKKSLKNSVSIDKPMTINANWKEQYYLQLTSSVSGKSILGSGWYDKGQKVSIITDKEFRSDSNTKYVFDRWDLTGNNAAAMDNSVSNVASLTINGANTVTANWKKFYFVSVLSQYGTVAGSGYYEEGSMADISVTPTDYTILENKRKAVFDRWTGAESQNSPIPFGGASGKLQNEGAIKSSGAQGNQMSRGQLSSPSAKIKVDRPMTLVANWKDQYFLTLNSKQGLVSGSGWYTAGQTANIEVTQPSTPPGIWLRYMFDGWSGDYQGELIKENVVMTGPKTISAKWKEDYSPAVMNSMIMAGVGAAGLFVYKKTKKTGIGMTIADKIRLRMSHVEEPIHEEVYNEKWERKIPMARTNYNPTEYQYALFAPRTLNRVIMSYP